MGEVKKAVVLLSGGLDSATALAMAHAEGYELYTLSFDYGQRHDIELDAARRISDHYRVMKHLVIKINLREIRGSALTSHLDVPKDREQKKDQGTKITNSGKQEKTEIPVTYVPARNTIFLSLALAWAESLHAADIFIGVNAIDYSGYPDCRPEYIRAFEVMANLATKVSVKGDVKFKIRTPLIELSKAELIKKGSDLGVDYSLTWSCYDPQNKVHRAKSKEQGTQGTDNRSYKYVPCGRCDSCMLRARGFKEAGLSDPLAADPGYS